MPNLHYDLRRICSPTTLKISGEINNSQFQHTISASSFTEYSHMCQMMALWSNLLITTSSSPMYFFFLHSTHGYPDSKRSRNERSAQFKSGCDHFENPEPLKLNLVMEACNWWAKSCVRNTWSVKYITDYQKYIPMCAVLILAKLTSQQPHKFNVTLRWNQVIESDPLHQFPGVVDFKYHDQCKHTITLLESGGKRLHMLESPAQNI